MRKWRWLALGWTLVISVLCLVSFNTLPEVPVSGADKWVHAAFHFVFVLLWAAYWRSRQDGGDLGKVLLKSLFWSLFFGVTIEVCQKIFTESRQADLGDVLANLSGAILACIGIWLFRSHFVKPKMQP